MEPVTGTAIRDFRIRGNYINQRNLLSRRDLDSSQERRTSSRAAPDILRPWWSSNSTEAQRAASLSAKSIFLSSATMTLRRRKGYLSLILNARRGDPQAAKDYALAAQEYSLGGLEPPQPTESSFVVPSTSCQPHSEQDISQKGFILLKLSQLGYPVPDFVVLTACAYADRAQRLEEHVSEAIKQLEILTMQGLGDCKSPLVFAIRCATGTLHSRSHGHLSQRRRD